MSLFRYFANEQHADGFMRKGEMRFGSLAYYRGIEDGGVRGDPKDGMLHYEPTGGIDVENFDAVVSTCLEAGATHVVPHVYTSIVDKATGNTVPDLVAELNAKAAALA